MNREEEAIVVTHRFGLIGRRRKFFERNRMDIEVFLKMENIFRSGVRHVEPRNLSERDGLHSVFVWTESAFIIPYES